MSTPAAKQQFLGIDIGSVSLSLVVIDQQRNILHHDYVFHHGNISQILYEKLIGINFSHVAQVGYNHRSSDFFSEGDVVNDQLASIEGILFQNNRAGSAIAVGGETFGLVLFDEHSQYKKYISNSSCAAGTGAFLDQQAERLGLSGSAELSCLADSFQGQPPKIATRCAVFAKTDLIHCQQQGYSLEAISAGLCQGLAHNIYATLFKGVSLIEPVMAVGGVSKNPRVMHYLSKLIGFELIVPEHSVLTGAIGCAVIAQKRSADRSPGTLLSIDTLLKKQEQVKHYFYGPLSVKLSAYPEFTDHRHYLSHGVEVDAYDAPLQEGRVSAYLGIDIGSTSTKAVVMDADQSERILYGLYTRTAGQPIQATQSLLRVLREIEKEEGIRFEFKGVGTTGSGRKFIKEVISADLVIDEITAHARAAYSLNPDVDTIIEIGGQDSKFTVMRKGNVIFSVMNYVCAAGTGSFIEEQAKRLDVPLVDYASRAMGAPSPLTSDRCTVFMERDLNYYLAQGYSREELLAAALHSVGDNYLSKVAHLNKIGQVICFQGATAKNEALVAVFEKKLHKPIFVSKYCHLTGALGVCLVMKEKKITETRFRGIDFYKHSPLITEEVCDLCSNHCKLKHIQVMGESITWGFLCGRDETDDKRKSTNQAGFDLIRSRRRIFNPANRLKENIEIIGNEKSKIHPRQLIRRNLDLSLEKLHENMDLGLMNIRHRLFAVRQSDIQEEMGRISLTIGIPNTLYNLEFAPFWKFFFTKLGYEVYVTSPKDDFMNTGKELTGAEFCAPISYWHGHIQELSHQCDYMFLPQMLTEWGADQTFYCYYSNYAVALIQNIRGLGIENRCIAPAIDFSLPPIHNIQRIYESLPQELKLLQTPSEMKEAFTQALNWFQSRNKLLFQVYQEQRKQLKDVSVVLLGRPYLIFDPVMNKNIPEAFNQLGIKTFSQDMLPQSETELDGPAREFLSWNHWGYGDQILRAAEFVGKTPGLYPVYLSAFKCSPDSFVINYFKEIMDEYQKPYLILQIDEHGSDVGYGTRVESAAATFRNHFRHNEAMYVKKIKPADPFISFKDKTILLPNYDPICIDLISAAFKHAGYQAYTIEEDTTTVLSSLRLNDGQCLPISCIVQGAVETIQKKGLKPEDTVLFLNAISPIPCNFPQYPILAEMLLKQRGEGYEKVQVFATEFTMQGLPLELVYDIYCAFLLGGLLHKIGCKLRPYERIKGQTDQLIADARKRLHYCIENGESKEAIFVDIVDAFLRLPLRERNRRPKVAIIGDLYVRDNDVFNQQLIADLESYGAEVVTVPLIYLLRLSAAKQSRSFNQDGRYPSSLLHKILFEVAERFEKHFFKIADQILNEGLPVFYDSIFDDLENYKLSLKQRGETIQNVMKIFSLVKHYPDIKLFVHVNPIFCCPGLVSESIFKTIENDIGIPIVSIIYDGTTTQKNEILAPYMHYILQTISERERLVARERSSF